MLRALSFMRAPTSASSSAALAMLSSGVACPCLEATEVLPVVRLMGATEALRWLPAYTELRLDKELVADAASSSGSSAKVFGGFGSMLFLVRAYTLCLPEACRPAAVTVMQTMPPLFSMLAHQGNMRRMLRQIGTVCACMSHEPWAGDQGAPPMSPSDLESGVAMRTLRDGLGAPPRVDIADSGRSADDGRAVLLPWMAHRQVSSMRGAVCLQGRHQQYQ